MECNWVIRPPTRVHLSVGRTSAISATFGHGSGQPPVGAPTSMIGRSMPDCLSSGIFAEQLQPADQDPLSRAAFARVEGGGGVDGSERPVEGCEVLDELDIHIRVAQGDRTLGVLAKPVAAHDLCNPVSIDVAVDDAVVLDEP